MQCGFPLMITIIKFLVSLFRKEKESSLFYEFLENDQKKKIFRHFCKHEWSYENFSSYEEIQKYKNIKDEENRKKIAVQIYELYFNGKNSELEVNIPISKSNDIKEKMKNNQFKEDLFDQALISVFENLTDTYSRFMLTPLFERVMEKEILLKVVNE